MTYDMDGGAPVRVIEALRNVPADKIGHIYGQIQRLIQETHGKIQLDRYDASSSLIWQLKDADTDAMAQTFTNDLIARVNDNTFLTHITAAWKQVQVEITDQLQELARLATSHPQRLEPDDCDLTQPRGLGSRTAMKEDN